MKTKRQTKMLELIKKHDIEILVIKTVSGMAMAVAAAIDAMHLHEIVGCIAGDDTIMCAVRSVDDTIAVMSRLRKLVED